MYQRLTATFFMIVLLNSIAVKSYSQPGSLNDLEISSPSREIDSGFGKYFWNLNSDNSPGSEEEHIHHDNYGRGRRRYSGRIKKRMICARDAALQGKKRQHFRHGIKISSEKENVGAQIENALLCNYERVRRELRKINISLAPQEEMETNFQIIIDSELAKTILHRLSILSSPSSEEKNSNSISMKVEDNEKEKGVLEEHSDQTNAMNENDTEPEDADDNEKEKNLEVVTEVPLSEDALMTAEDSVLVTPSAEQEIELTTLTPADEEEEENIQSSADKENELSTINSSEPEEELSPLQPTETTMVEDESNGDNSLGNQIDEDAGNSLTCNFTAYQEMKLRCKGMDDATEGEGLPCSMMGLWVSDAGGVQLDIKAGTSRGFLDVQAHDLTPPKKGFLSPSWKIVGQLPFLDIDENVRTSDEAESKVEDSLGGIFSLTATIPGASSETGEKQLAIFIGECRVCDGGMDTVVGIWSLKRPSKSCRDAILSLQEIQDVLRRDILSESIKSKSKRMIKHKAKRAHRDRLHRNKFRIFH